MSRRLLTPDGQPSTLVDTALSRARTHPGFGDDVSATLSWCVEVGQQAPLIGGGRTGELWELLAATATHDVSAARMLEPHLDALDILRQATNAAQGDDPIADPRLQADQHSSWGVFAAEAPGARVRAHHDGGSWTLTGTKHWCSLAQHLSHALVTAFVDDEQRALFAVDLRQPGVRPHGGPWVARGLPNVVSAPVDFEGAHAVPVGDPNWYLTRPGFAWGAISVAACWWGAAVGVAEPLLAAASSARADQVALVHLGRADAALWAARSTLLEAAAVVDAGGSADTGDRLLAGRVRSIVADAATLVLGEADAALGPVPLVTDRLHARRVADLHLYLRQHHGLRDVARIGRNLVANGGASW